MNDPHARAREMVVESPDGEGAALRMEGVFPKMERTPGAVRYAGKRMGADNDEIFSERLGLSAAEMAGLRGQGII
jgi:crotonobetainyl-CoA:carnitine CoA-transferase CaiB-like acyl-CoA transferase